MWMTGYSDGGENIYSPTTTITTTAAAATTSTTNNESFSGSRKLRPLIPRPPPSQPQRHRHHGRGSGGVNNADDFLVLNHHLAAMAEQSKRELNNAPAQQVVVSSRWNPTPEQLGTLEDLWRRGTRTPSADEIQQITSRLRRYGKIEGKNVFYWFQNHKARERQKRRRQMESGGCQGEENDHADGGLNEQPESGNLCNKEAGGRSSKTSSEDVRRSNNNSSSNSNRESAADKEGILMASVGGGSGYASLFVAASAASSSSVVRSPLLWMKTLSENNSVPSGEPLLHSPNSSVFGLSGGCCCRSDDNDGNANVNNVPLEWRNAAWHPHPSSAPGQCRPLVLPPFPAMTGHLRVRPDTTASHSSSPASSSQLANPDFPTLQLFPVRSNCDQEEEDYLEGCMRGRQEDPCDHLGTGMDEFARTDNVDRHQFFEFLPLKN